MNKQFILSDDIDVLGNEIKNFFIEKGNFVIIKNYNYLSDQEIIKIYDNLNSIIGKKIPIDLVKDTYELTDNYWADVKYTYDSDEKQFWRSSNHQNLHTDNTFCDKEHYANLSELVCLKPVEYSGNTVIIPNNKLVDIIKFVDKHVGSNLYNEILDLDIYYNSRNNLYSKRKILTYDKINNQYIFCFNYFPANRGKNLEDEMNIVNKLNNFLEEKLMLSSDIMYEIKLNRGDALIFNDELVMHGRKSFIGTRHYIKTGIQLDEASFYNNMNLIQEIR